MACLTKQQLDYIACETAKYLSCPDEEDITLSKEQKLKFKDRYAEDGDGMGYVILRKNKSFAEQVTEENTIYEVRYDFDLGGTSVTIPAGCVLDFVGGSVSNGKILCDSTIINSRIGYADTIGCILEGDYVFNNSEEPIKIINGKTRGQFNRGVTLASITNKPQSEQPHAAICGFTPDQRASLAL